MAVAVVVAFVVLGTSVGVLAQDAHVPPDGASPSPSPEASLAAGIVTGYQARDESDSSEEDLELMSPSVTVEAGDMWFAPNEIAIASDEPTTLVLVGAGQMAHNLVVDELGLQLFVGPGISTEIDLSELPPGTYPFYCSIYGHRRAGMHGTLTVG